MYIRCLPGVRSVSHDVATNSHTPEAARGVARCYRHGWGVGRAIYGPLAGGWVPGNLHTAGFDLPARPDSTAVHGTPETRTPRCAGRVGQDFGSPAPCVGRVRIIVRHGMDFIDSGCRNRLTARNRVPQHCVHVHRAARQGWGVGKTSLRPLGRGWVPGDLHSNEIGASGRPVRPAQGLPGALLCTAPVRRPVPEPVITRVRPAVIEFAEQDHHRDAVGKRQARWHVRTITIHAIHAVDALTSLHLQHPRRIQE